MIIFVKRSCSELLTLGVIPSDTIKNVKAKIQGKGRILMDNQMLVYLDVELDDDETLEKYHIKDEAVLYIKQVEQVKFQIFVKTLTYESIPLQVTPNDTFKTVKVKIQNKKGIHPDHQSLFFVGKEMNDKQTLADYNIKDSYTLHLTIKKEARLQISINILEQKTIVLEVGAYDTVKDLKIMIQNEENIPFDQQCLIFSRKQLENENTILNYGITNGSIINLLKHDDDRINAMTSSPWEFKGMEIFVKCLSGKICTFWVNGNDIIGSIKPKIDEKVGHNPELQCFIYNGKQLDDTKTFADYNIEEHSRLHLVLPFK